MTEMKKAKSQRVNFAFLPKKKKMEADGTQQKKKERKKKKE